jgi:hypothetical protein
MKNLPQWHLHGRHHHSWHLNLTAGDQRPLLGSAHLRRSISELPGPEGGHEQLGGARLEGEVFVLDAKHNRDH